MHDRSKNMTSQGTTHNQRVKKITGKSPPETFKQAMNFLFSMRHLWDGSHSPIRGSCKKSVEGIVVVLLSLSSGFCTSTSLPVLVPSMESPVLLFSATTFLCPPSSCTLCSVLGFASPFFPVLPAPESATVLVVPLFVPAGRVPVPS